MSFNTVEFHYIKVAGKSVLQVYSIRYPILFNFKPLIFCTKNCEKKLFIFLFSVIEYYYYY